MYYYKYCSGASPPCFSNCHEGCSLDFTLGGPDIYGCDAFGRDERREYCKQPSCGHHRDLHFHQRYVWAEETKTENLTDVYMKAKYDEAKDQAAKAEMLLNAIEGNLERAQGELVGLIRDLENLTHQYEQLGMLKSYRKFLSTQKDLLEYREQNEKDNGVPLNNRVRVALRQQLEQVNRKLGALGSINSGSGDALRDDTSSSDDIDIN